MKKLFFFAPLMAVLFSMNAQPARADMLLMIGIGNAALSGYPGPYGSVNVHLNGGGASATVTYTSNTVAGNIYLFGDGSSVALNVNGGVGSVSFVGNPANAGTGFTNSAVDMTPNFGGGNVSSFGNFNFTMDTFDGFNHAWDSFEFTIYKASGTWASENDILLANADGYRAAGHIFVTTSPANASNGALVTGFAADGGTPVVPEPATMLLLGLGLAGAGAARARRRRK